MVALLEVGTAGATREHLVKKASIGTTTFYRVMKPLIERNLVTQQDSRYHLPLSEWYNYRFKLWHDGERLYQLNHKDRSDALDILNHARHSLGDSLSCLWLVGSAAHGTLLSTSDFDFLAVVRDPTLYHPTAPRKVNFVTLTAEEFRDRFDSRDGFVLSALHYGLVLLDRDFAQSYYARTVSIEFADQKLHESERALDRQRKRFFSHLEDDDLEVAAGLLETLAANLTRIMLQVLGELPAGKPDLLNLSKLLLGSQFHQWLKSAMAGHTEKKRQLKIMRQWTDYRDRFLENTSHLKVFARLPYARGQEFDEQCAAILNELLPRGHARDGCSGVDLAMSDAKATYLIDFKSMERQVETTAVDQLWSKVPVHARQQKNERVHKILVANTWRSVPVAERLEAFSDVVLDSADEKGVHLLSGVDLLRAHNILHLEEATPEQTFKQILSQPKRLARV